MACRPGVAGRFAAFVAFGLTELARIGCFVAALFAIAAFAGPILKSTSLAGA
jgi:hypothetical protein